MTAASVALWTLLAGPSRPARVLEIVDGTVYLQVDALAAADSRDGRGHPGAIVALLPPDAVQLPIGIVLPPAAAELIPVSVAGSAISRGKISIGWGAISLAEVRWPVLDWWNPGIPALPLPALSIAAESETDTETETETQPDAADPTYPELSAGLAALRSGDVEAAVRQLIGAGAGLLPPGDDVLGGALAALAAWAPDASARTALATAVAGALERTSPVSAALLQSAATGFAVPELTRYLTALSTGAADLDPGPGSVPVGAELAGRWPGSGTAVALGVGGQLRALLSGRSLSVA